MRGVVAAFGMDNRMALGLQGGVQMYSLNLR